MKFLRYSLALVIGLVTANFAQGVGAIDAFTALVIPPKFHEVYIENLTDMNVRVALIPGNALRGKDTRNTQVTVLKPGGSHNYREVDPEDTLYFDPVFEKTDLPPRYNDLPAYYTFGEGDFPGKSTYSAPLTLLLLQARPNRVYAIKAYGMNGVR